MFRRRIQTGELLCCCCCYSVCPLVSGSNFDGQSAYFVRRGVLVTFPLLVFVPYYLFPSSAARVGFPPKEVIIYC